MIVSIDVQKLSNYPLCVNISRHINSVTPCPELVTLCPPRLKISEMDSDFSLCSNFVVIQTTKPHNLLKTDRAEN